MKDKKEIVILLSATLFVILMLVLFESFRVVKDTSYIDSLEKITNPLDPTFDKSVFLDLKSL